MKLIILILIAMVAFTFFGLILYLVKYKKREIKPGLTCKSGNHHPAGNGSDNHDHDPCPDCSCGRSL